MALSWLLGLPLNSDTRGPQVYNGRVYDLLSPSASHHRPLPVVASARQGAATGFSVGRREQNAADNSEGGTTTVAEKSSSGARLVGVSAHAVDDAEQVMELLRQGARNRRVRSTEVCVLFRYLSSSCEILPVRHAKGPGYWWWARAVR